MANVSAELIWGLTQHHVSTSPHYCAYFSLLHHVMPLRVLSPAAVFTRVCHRTRSSSSKEAAASSSPGKKATFLTRIPSAAVVSPTLRQFTSARPPACLPLLQSRVASSSRTAPSNPRCARLIPHASSNAHIFRKALATCACLALACPLTFTPLGCQRRREEPGQGQEGRSQGCRQHCLQEEQRHPQRKAPKGRQQGLHQDRPPRPPGQRIGTLFEGARSPRADQQARRSTSVSAWQERSWCRSRGLPREPRQLFKGQAHSEEARAGTFPQTHDAPARNSPAARLRRFLNCCKSLCLFKPARLL